MRQGSTKPVCERHRRSGRYTTACRSVCPRSLARTAIDAQDHLRHAVTQAQEANPRRRDRRLEVVRLLIEAGADPSQPAQSSADGWTAAEAAQFAKDSELTAILIMRQVKGT